MTMTGKTVTRLDLYAAVYKKVGLSRTESLALVESVLKEITDAFLAKEETVKLTHSDLSLCVRNASRLGRNPKTGVEVPISPRSVIVFRPSAVLKLKINGKRPGTRKPAAELLSSAPTR